MNGNACRAETSMQRFTISLNDQLAEQFDSLIGERGYSNRSEAVRDLIRARIGNTTIEKNRAKWCVASISFVYDHHDRPATERVTELQHRNHDLVVTSSHVHLDHANCLETVVVRGDARAVQAFAQDLVALRGIRHGNVHLVPLAEEHKTHRHDTASASTHRHLKPLS